MVKDREAKEAQVAKDTPIETSSATDKGKGLMGEIPQASIDQQVNSYLHTSEQIKQKLSRMTSALDTQEVTTPQPTKATQVIIVVQKYQSEQTQIEEKHFKNMKAYVSSILTSTIDLTHSKEKDEKISPMPITVETGNGNDLYEFYQWKQW